LHQAILITRFGLQLRWRSRPFIAVFLQVLKRVLTNFVHRRGRIPASSELRIFRGVDDLWRQGGGLDCGSWMSCSFPNEHAEL
jgi:hypothetical protein